MADEQGRVQEPGKVDGHVEPITEHGHTSAPPAVAENLDKKAEEAAKRREKERLANRSDDELRNDIRKNRDELARTLDALEYKLDVPARAEERLEVEKERARRLWAEKPMVIIGAGVGAVALIAGSIALSVWLAGRGRNRRNYYYDWD